MRLRDCFNHYLIARDADIADYYAQIAAAQPADLLSIARTRDAEGTVPGEARNVMYNIAAEIKNRFNEYGAPIPPLLEGCTVVDLCCGTGRDVYLAAQLVGATGKVIGVEPNAERLAIAQKYLDKEMRQFGYAQSNVEFVCACPEDLSMIEDNSVDVVMSNCTFNVSPDKETYLAEVMRILKEGGEFYFTDVFTDRRIPRSISTNIARRAEHLGGALYIHDFRRLAQFTGFLDPRYLITNKTELTQAEQAAYPGIAFATITCRLINSSAAEDICEAFGETITYKGTLPDYPDYFLFDTTHKFPTGITCTVCSNVTACVGYESRYAQVFDITGCACPENHLGEIAGDTIIKTAPAFDGVRDEDDIEVQASCC